MNTPGSGFHGAKAAILIGDRLLITLRDDLSHITHPNQWDLPGGGREGDETPRETLAREVREEVSLDLGGAEWLWEAEFPSGTHPGRRSWFFVLRLPAAAEAQVRLGDEGQAWRLVPPHEYLLMPDAVPFLQHRLRVGLSALASEGALP